ncbi:septal ring lytic transglycosylase RlpA family protein [Pontibacter sp. G13]|uniref:septal ring lytic transglycosylase RlpA family protein n=1 Tax=Pontibacter sp. G13 TaxID=3074898 RepID=UPI00288A4CBF|nr:septal ring lytic transglycosylase RlpA family protein [Pontibacter sp. G13]WNJ20134.1 septal ring lytic transglycosylase RlpA family protein [Pontibacter sp. G13]
MSRILLSLMISMLSFAPLWSQTETGEASYYGDKLHGNPTASGEPYDKTKYTAAHKELKFGTIIEVTNNTNGKTVRVRVNDRGPYKAGRIVDLSRVAAESIGLIRAGVAPVTMKVVGGGPLGPVNGSSSGSNTSQGNYRPSSQSSTRPRTNPPTSRNRLGTQPRYTQSAPAANTRTTSSSNSGGYYPSSDFVMPRSQEQPKLTDISHLEVVDINGNPIPKAGQTSTPQTNANNRVGIPQNETQTSGAPVVEPPVTTTPSTAQTYTPALFQLSAAKLANSGYAVQVGAFFDYYRLLEGLNQLNQKGFTNTLVHNSMKDGKPIFRILVGPYDTMNVAKDQLTKLTRSKVKGLVVDLSQLK